MASFGQNFSPARTSGSGVVSIMAELTADGLGQLTTAGIKGDAGAIKRIFTGGGAPDGVWFIELQFPAVRFLYSSFNVLHTSIDTAANQSVIGGNAPSGFDANQGAVQIVAYATGGVPLLPPAGTQFLIRMDVQTENWGAR